MRESFSSYVLKTFNSVKKRHYTEMLENKFLANKMDGWNCDGYVQEQEGEPSIKNWFADLFLDAKCAHHKQWR